MCQHLYTHTHTRACTVHYKMTKLHLSSNNSFKEYEAEYEYEFLFACSVRGNRQHTDSENITDYCY